MVTLARGPGRCLPYVVAQLPNEREIIPHQPLARDDALFDEAICEIWHRQMNLVLEDEQRTSKH